MTAILDGPDDRDGKKDDPCANTTQMLACEGGGAEQEGLERGRVEAEEEEEERQTSRCIGEERNKKRTRHGIRKRDSIRARRHDRTHRSNSTASPRAPWRSIFGLGELSQIIKLDFTLLTQNFP
eukprot:1414840-Rhodomonas_salina.3